MNTLPAHLANRSRHNILADATGGLAAAQPAHISIEANRFWLVDPAGNKMAIPQFHLDVVVIDANPVKSKIYYETEFDPSNENYAPPTCFSDNGIAPSANAMVPQSALCATCPNNVWGSDVSKFSGKGIPACRDLKKLAVYCVGDPRPNAYLLRVPPATLKNLNTYCKTLATNRVDLWQVVTRLEFESQGVLNFRAMAFIDENAARMIDEIDKMEQDQKALSLIVGRLDQPRQAALPAPSGAQPGPAQQQVPPPQPQPNLQSTYAAQGQQPFAQGNAAQGQQPFPNSQPAAGFPAQNTQGQAGFFGAPQQPQGNGFAGQPQVQPGAQEPVKRTRGRRPAAEPVQQPGPQPAQQQPQSAPQAPFLREGGQQQAPQQNAAAAPPRDDLDPPDFLRRDQPAAPTPSAPGGVFGQATPADQGIVNALQQALNLPTQ